MRKTNIRFNGYFLARNKNQYHMTKINNYMKREIIEINVNLKNGNKGHTIYGNDLNYEYIKINADYRS